MGVAWLTERAPAGQDRPPSSPWTSSIVNVSDGSSSCRACSNAATASARVQQSPMRNGFPHREGRATTTTLSGSRQPAWRLS